MGVLDGKVALVTGAGSGIGRAAALALAQAGAGVVVNDLTPDGLDETVAEIQADGGEAAAAVGDVRSRADVAEAVETARDRFGGLDFLLANAAVSVYEELEHQSEATKAELEGKGATFSSPIADRGFGLTVMMDVPGADPIMLYQPKHPTAHDL